MPALLNAKFLYIASNLTRLNFDLVCNAKKYGTMTTFHFVETQSPVLLYLS